MSKRVVSDWFLSPNTKRGVSEITSELSARLKYLGFDSFVYQGAPVRMRSDLSAPSGQKIFRTENLASCGAAIFSQFRHRQLLRCYYENFAQIDPNFQQSTKLSLPFVHRFQPSGSGNLNKVSRFFNTQGIHSILNWPLPVPNNRHWAGLFRLNSGESTTELQKRLPSIQSDISSILLMIHMELQQHHRAQFNPYTKLEVLNPKGVAVVRYIAQGHNRSYIADRLSISERGVDYHVEQLACKLGVDNRIQLLSLCHQLELFNTGETCH